MESKPKYIEEKRYELDDEFLMNIRSFGRAKALRIGTFLDKTIHQIDDVSGELQIFGGVIDDLDDGPFFFEIELYKDEESLVTLFDINQIDGDEYLDLINSNSYLNERMDINSGNC
jgi:hypothetical protein